ncbi:MAG: DUF4190 domain-containing protein [Oscillospiraceae bacterium]|nr:DUF4190 domain-containing protein [Oscillospiraceae bacterium]
MENNKTLAIVGLVLSFIFPVVGIIISAVALNKMKQSGVEEGKGLATAGLVLGIVFTAIYVLLVGCLCVCGAGLAAAGY